MVPTDRLRVVLSAGSHASFKAGFSWDVPRIGVLFGTNGAGKSQLLNLIKLAAASHHRSKGQQFTGSDSLEPWRIVLVSSPPEFTRAKKNSSTIDALASEEASAHAALESQDGGFRGHIRELHGLGQRGAIELGRPVDLTTKFGPMAVRAPMWEPAATPRQLQDLALAWARGRAMLREQDPVPRDSDVRQRLGEPPWEIINDVLRRAGLAPRMCPPASGVAPFDLQFSIPSADERISWADLSSGEATLVWLATILMESHAQDRGIKLLLCDEPDAHLHSSAIPGFYGALKESLVDRYACRVICTTHRAETLAQVPEDWLWEVSREEPRVRRPTSRGEAAATLTAGLIEVMPSTRFVFVEADADRQFYEGVLTLVSALPDVKPDAAVRFLPPSPIRNESGGRTKVEAEVVRLRRGGLESFVVGLVDRDHGPSKAEGVVSLKRYCHENYLFDPIVVYAALVEHGRGGEFPSGGHEPHQVAEIRALPPARLQGIVDQVVLKIRQSTERTEDDEMVAVRYTLDVEFQIPRWIVGMKGRDLARHVHAAWSVSRREALAAHARLGVVSIDLLEAFQRLGLVSVGDTHEG